MANNRVVRICDGCEEEAIVDTYAKEEHPFNVVWLTLCCKGTYKAYYPTLCKECNEGFYSWELDSELEICEPCFIKEQGPEFHDYPEAFTPTTPKPTGLL